MAIIERAIQDKIVRLSRKEIRKAISPLMDTTRELKKRVRAMELALKAMEQTVKPLAKEHDERVSTLQATPEELQNARFSSGLIKKLRKKIGVTQKELAQLLEVHPMSVAFWEAGKTSPAEENKSKMIALRKLGKRDVRRLLGGVAHHRPQTPPARRGATIRPDP